MVARPEQLNGFKVAILLLGLALLALSFSDRASQAFRGFAGVSGGARYSAYGPER